MSADEHSSFASITHGRNVVLVVGVFGGVSAFPLRVALSRGLFARAGLDVDLRITPSSDALAAGLLDGTYQIVHAAPDNYVAWSDRTGIPIDAWVGGSNGPVALVSRRDVEVSGLRGARIGVDAPTSGFAPILRRLLAQGGVTVDDVELVKIGATHGRAAALRDGSVDATMLPLPWSTLAVRDGAYVIADHTAVAPFLLTSCGGSLRSWLDDHLEVAGTYFAAVVAALAVLRDPSQRAAATMAVVTDMGVDEAQAEEILTQMLGPSGWPPTCAVDAKGIEVACALRTEVVGPPLRPPTTYIDDRPRRWSIGELP